MLKLRELQQKQQAAKTGDTTTAPSNGDKQYRGRGGHGGNNTAELRAQKGKNYYLLLKCVHMLGI